MIIFKILFLYKQIKMIQNYKKKNSNAFSKHKNKHKKEK
jgi:hypothetical protein